MKELTLTEMAEVTGGDGAGFVDGVCVGFGLVAGATGGAAAANPVGGTVALACGVWATGRLFDWW